MKVQCPNCGDTEFAEQSTVSVTTPIENWVMRGNVPKPDSYSTGTVIWDTDSIDEDDPYMCINCNHTFKAHELKVEP
jgi:hypothetical protein